MNVTVNIAVDGQSYAVHQIPNLPAGARPTYGVMNYTKSETEAALAVWDWLLEERNGWASTYFDAHGTPGMRRVAMQASRAVEAVWQYLEGEQHFHEPFDFEFVPLAMQALPLDKIVSNAINGDGRYMPETRTVAFSTWKLAEDKFIHWKESRSLWSTIAEAYCAAAYGAILLLTEEDLCAGFKAGTSPTGYVDRLAASMQLGRSPILAL